MPIPILVVDDEPNFLRLMGGVLGKRGFDVKTALNCEEALKLVDEEYFDFALVDMRLGSTDGAGCLEKIKQRQPHIRAVAVTGYPTDAMRLEASLKGASAYLAKPLDLQGFLHTFTSILSP